MKYVNNGVSHNIIKDSDINLSESFQNQTLSEVLGQYREDLNLLKSNVKWLAKYGGVGGSGSGGGSGSSNVKLKYKVDLQYVNNADITSAGTFASGSSSNKILAKDGSIATITVTLQRCAPDTKYAVQIIYGEQKYTKQVDSLSLFVSQKVTCTGNSPLTVVVYADPSDMPSTSVQIYTVAKNASLDLTLGSSFIASGGIILKDQVSENSLIGTLTNYLPTDYEGNITEVLVNNVSKEFTIEEIDGNSGESIKQFKIPAGDIFDNYGIFEIIMYYEYNGIQEFIKNTYIYKDSPAFLYCFGTNNVVYSNLKESPSTSNSTVETVMCRIYPTQGGNATTYNGSYSISYEDKESANIGPVELNRTPYTDFKLNFSNPYSKNDFNESITYKKVTITFQIYDDYGTNIYEYYVYIHQLPDISYFFKDDSDRLFCHAIHSCTATINEEGENACTTFPFENGQFKKLIKDETHRITKLSTTTGLTESASCVYGLMDGSGKLSGGYVSNYANESAAENPDVLVSFGLKYDEFNQDLPILTIAVSEAFEITLYSNRIAYGSNQKSSRWCIPRDDQYHLIQLYFKPYYSSSYQTNLPSQGAFMWCVDGVFETAPITFNKTGFSAHASRGSYITYYTGNWDFNFIGVASFNAKPNESTWNSRVNAVKDDVIRYVLDFDPIIPANYYQAYYEFMYQKPYPKAFDKSIYTKLFSAAAENEYGINFYKGLNKFIPFDILTLSKLSDLPIYVISPTPKQTTTNNNPINQFLYNTYAGQYAESTDLGAIAVPCTFKKAVINGTEVSYETMVGDAKYSFSITFQGSSTLKYSSKNFEISADQYKDPDDDEKLYDVFWTPDESRFLPESSFTLKADVVDSSHSNNVIVGKFVNDYMKDSALQEGAKTCLEGFPILLFMEDTLESDEGGTPNTIFLGIYSFNLGRNSVFNLGYKNLNKEKCEVISAEGSTAKAYLVKDVSAVEYPINYRVAEVQGNSPVLYDYSQYDQMLLKDLMLGDFFIYDGQKSSDEYSDHYQRPFKGLNKLIYQKFIVDLSEYYTSYTFTDNSQLAGYYKTVDSAGIFNVLQLNFNYSGKYDITDRMYYKNSSNNLTKITEGLVLDKTQVDTIKPYLMVGDNDLSVIGNPLYQFHAVCDANGIISKDPQLFYVEQTDSPLPYNQSDDYFNYDNTLRYYIICMLFAMVDSVQKNLTIRCKHFDPNIGNEWLLGFYDMDTSFGVDNIGNPVDFKAFSDYISSEGKIISDFYEEDAENKAGSGFDVPSSYLFLLAKYINILALDTETTLPLGTRTYEENNTYLLKTPFNYWQTLRSNQLSNIDDFFNIYVDSHFGELNPILWNLDYLYKYFSVSNNTSSDDTEQSKFNGTRKHSRKSWMKQRVEILDVLFGIRNNHKIGNSSTSFIGAVSPTNNNPSFINTVSISKTMFPAFSKGFLGNINVTIQTTPRTPVVMQTSTSDYVLYITDDTGKAEGIKADITSNTDCGFFGTTQIAQVSECGQFLANTADNTNNTVKNDIIQTITINKFPKNGKQTIVLDLKDIPSAKNILINSDGSSTFKAVSFTISNDKGGERIIDNLEIVNCIFESSLGIIGGANDIITINNLKITDCVGTDLNLQNIKVLNWVFSDNNFKNYTFVGEFPKNITISDSKAKSCTFNLQKNENIISISTSNLEKLHLQGSISQFVNNSTNNCNDITIQSITTSVVNLQLKQFQNYDHDLAIPLDNATELTLSCYDNLKQTSLQITGSKLNKINLLTQAFKGNCKLSSILLNNTNWLDKAAVYVNGSYAFCNCSILPSEYIIPTTSTNLYLNSTNPSYIYAGTAVSMDDVINFFKYIKTTVTSINLTRAFGGCSQLGFNLTVNDVGKCTYPDKYDDFVSAVQSFKQNKSVTMDYMFIGTSFNFLDNTLVKLFKNGNSLTESVRDTSDNVLYVSSDFLNGKDDNDNVINGNITTLSLSNSVSIITTPSYYGKIKFYDKNSLQILSNVNLKEILNNGKLTTIGTISLYTNDNIKVDCTGGGFPETVKSIQTFFCNTSKFNYTNFEEIFNGLKDCSVQLDRFFGVQAKLTVTNPVNIKKLLLDDDGNPKIIFKLRNKSTYLDRDNSTAFNRAGDINWGLNFDKTCTATEFKCIMEYLLREQKAFLENGSTTCDWYNQIPGLFSNCIITGVNTFKDLITAEDEKSFFTRRYEKNLDDEQFNASEGVNYIDLYRTFQNCQLKHVGDNVTLPFDCSKLWEELVWESNDVQVPLKTPIVTMFRTFEGTNQEKIMEPFHIKDVKNMQYCFYDCQYEIPSGFDNIKQDPAEGLTFTINWAWKDKFPLLPEGFFSGFNLCDVTQCFASSSMKGLNLQGQLFTENGWWNEGDVTLTTVDNLTTGALIHPIVKEKSDKIDYYLYPKAYTDVFKSTKGAYNHTILPLVGDPNDEGSSVLYIYEDKETDLILGRLPQLPYKNENYSYYGSFLAKKQFVMQINENGVFNNSTSTPNSDYKQILPNSLFLVLNNFGFKNLTSIDKWKSPIIYNEGYNYYESYTLFNPASKTPGGITPNTDITNTTLLNRLRNA